MSQPICAAPQCDNPPHDGFLCQSCVGTLRRDLDAIPVLLEDLEVTVSRQDKIGDSDGRGATERPLPLRLGPMEARRDLTDTLRAWGEHIAGRRGTTHDSHDPRYLAEWMSMHLGDVQDDPRAGDIADEIGYAYLTAQRAVDKPLQHQYVGPCDNCRADLYAHPRSKVVACRNTPCEAEYNVEDRRVWLLEQAEAQLLTATEASRALPDLLPRSPNGTPNPLTASMIRNLAARGRLTQHPAHPKKPREPLYRVGELLSVLLTEDNTPRRRAS